MDREKDLKKYISVYGSIPDGHYSFDVENKKRPKNTPYEKTQARRDNMTNVGDLDYEI